MDNASHCKLKQLNPQNKDKYLRRREIILPGGPHTEETEQKDLRIRELKHGYLRQIDNLKRNSEKKRNTQENKKQRHNHGEKKTRRRR